MLLRGPVVRKTIPRGITIRHERQASSTHTGAHVLVGLAAISAIERMVVACFGNPDPVGMKVNYPFREETFNDDETTEEASS
jgi:hypothetical protein